MGFGREEGLGQTGRRAAPNPPRALEAVPGVPPVSALRFPGRELPSGEHAYGEAHTHDFLALA